MNGVGTVESRTWWPRALSLLDHKPEGHRQASIPTAPFKTYVLATLNREQVLDVRRENELDDIVAAAQQVKAETMEEGSA